MVRITTISKAQKYIECYNEKTRMRYTINNQKRIKPINYWQNPKYFFRFMTH